MLVLRLSLPLLEHSLADVAHHLLVVALQVHHAVDPLFLYLDLSLHACHSVHLLLKVPLRLPLLRLLEPLLKPKGGPLHISYNALISDRGFFCLDTLRHAADASKQLRVVVQLAATFLNLSAVQRVQHAHGVWTRFLGLACVVCAESVHLLFLEHDCAAMFGA